MGYLAWFLTGGVTHKELITAISEQDVNEVIFLLEKGIDVAENDNEAIELSKKIGNREIYRLLKKSLLMKAQEHADLHSCDCSQIDRDYSSEKTYLDKMDMLYDTTTQTKKSDLVAHALRKYK